jgi:hypothetical protein
MWDRNANNSVARSGLQLSLASLFIPLFAPLGLGFSIVGLRRVDLGARPPVGRKGQAIAGVVIGALGMVWLGVWVFWFATRMA